MYSVYSYICICMYITFIPIFIPAVDNDTVIPATISHWRTIIGNLHMSHEKTLVIRCIEGMKSYPVIWRLSSKTINYISLGFQSPCETGSMEPKYILCVSFRFFGSTPGPHHLRIWRERCLGYVRILLNNQNFHTSSPPTGWIPTCARSAKWSTALLLPWCRITTTVQPVSLRGFREVGWNWDIQKYVMIWWWEIEDLLCLGIFFQELCCLWLMCAFEKNKPHNYIYSSNSASLWWAEARHPFWSKDTEVHKKVLLGNIRVHLVQHHRRIRVAVELSPTTSDSDHKHHHIDNLFMPFL